MSRSTFDREKADVFPDLVFGYYSGGSRRLEKLFDSHQRRYYDAVKTNDDLEDCRRALALLWQILAIDRRNWIPESDFQ
jgi:hypothetical protein